jgi:hypothetical protein
VSVVFDRGVFLCRRSGGVAPRLLLDISLNSSARAGATAAAARSTLEPLRLDDAFEDGCCVDGSSCGTVTAVGGDAFDSFYLRGFCFTLENVQRLREARRWTGRWSAVYALLLRFNTSAVAIQRWWRTRRGEKN